MVVWIFSPDDGVVVTDGLLSAFSGNVLSSPPITGSSPTDMVVSSDIFRPESSKTVSAPVLLLWFSEEFFYVVFCVSGCTALSEAVCTVSVAVLSLSDADISTDGETLSLLTADSFFPSSEQPVSKRDIVTKANTMFFIVPP